jgi:transcriptional antiterminator RfaH
LSCGKLRENDIANMLEPRDSESDFSGHDATEPGEAGLSSLWYLAYTKPRFEGVAQVNLQQQAFDVYLPMYKKFKKTETGSVSVFEPMFPRYIFFRPTRPGQSISSVRSTKGVNNLVRFGFEYAVLQDNRVELIRQLEQGRNQISVLEASPFQAGQSVRLKHNALNNMQGLVQSVGSKRIAVLLEIMGRPTVVQVEHHQLEAD